MGKRWPEEATKIVINTVTKHPNKNNKAWIGIAARELAANGFPKTKEQVRKKIYSLNRSGKLAGKPEVVESSKEEAELDVGEFAKAALNEAEKRAKIIKAPNKKDIFTGPVEEVAVLQISDVHIGKKNSFIDLDTGKSYETYNNEIMMQQFNNLLQGVGRINALLSQGYTLKKLHIFGCGDLIDNDIIVKGQRFTIEQGVGGQFMLAVSVFSKFLTELLKTFEEIEFTITPGNHGRMTPKREIAPACNNWDYLLGEVLKIQFQNEPRIKIVTTESWFMLKDIYGWKYLLHHGDSVYSWMGMPYYGITRRGKDRRTEIPFDSEHCGHFHTQMEIPINSHTSTLLSGCWIEKDDYSWKKYGVLSWPKQWYFGVSPNRARTWQFPIELAIDDKNVQRQWQGWARINKEE